MATICLGNINHVSFEYIQNVVKQNAQNPSSKIFSNPTLIFQIINIISHKQRLSSFYIDPKKFHKADWIYVKRLQSIPGIDQIKIYIAEKEDYLDKKKPFEKECLLGDN